MTLTISSTFAFAMAMLVMAATPGPAFFALTARSIASGVKAGLGVSAGVAAADIIWFTFSLIGMTTISKALGSAFIAVKIIAGIYLAWLGLKMWKNKPINDTNPAAYCSRSFAKSFTEGLTVNLTNPKAIMFFAALLPTFFSLPDITLIDAAILIMIIAFVGIFTDLFYVLLAASLRKKLQSHRSQVLLNRIGGSALMGVGASVATR